MMLASRNIMLPSLYTDIVDKCNFYERSNAALKGDYSVIEHDVLERIENFRTLVMPIVDKKQGTKQVNMSDLEINSEGVNAQERIDTVSEMKGLSEINQGSNVKKDSEEVQQ